MQRLKSIACQIAGRVWACPMMEQITTSGLASAGVRPTSQMGNAVMPVPNPVRPETSPPANAPIRTSSAVASTSDQALLASEGRRALLHEGCAPLAIVLAVEAAAVERF